jgi:hypothetical protein
MNVAAPLMCRLTSRGATPALDFVPSMGTTPLSLVRLARAIAPERLVRSYAYRGIEDDAPAHSTIEAIAEANVAELRAAAPHGPYLIAGHCLGGAVAFAMASALEASGERVAAIVMIDAMAPIPADRPMGSIPDVPGLSTVVAHFGEVVQSLSARAIETWPHLEPDVARRLQGVLGGSTSTRASVPRAPAPRAGARAAHLGRRRHGRRAMGALHPDTQASSGARRHAFDAAPAARRGGGSRPRAPAARGRVTLAPRPAIDTPFVAPRDALEERVARLWEEVLRRAPLGADDDFFDLGGGSLQAFALIGRVHDAFAVRLTARDLFAAGTIAGMAGMIRERKSSP